MLQAFSQGSKIAHILLLREQFMAQKVIRIL